MRIRHLLAPAAALLVTAVLSGCSSGDSTTPVRYGATISMMGMSPHVGQLLEARIVHADTGVQVAYTKIDPVTSPDFDVWLPDALILGETYYIDFYADQNRNGRYDDPPFDHAWRRWIGPVGGNVALDFMHDFVWTDIDFPMQP